MPSSYNPDSPRARTFCDEYLLDLNGTKAAERAGYSPKRSRQAASELLRNPVVKARIEELMATRAEESRIKAYRVLEELSAIAFSDRRHFVVRNGELELAEGAPEDAMRAVSSVEYETKTNLAGVSTTKVKYRLWDKNAAITNAMKHLGIISDKLEVKNTTLEDLIRDAAGEETSAGDS